MQDAIARGNSEELIGGKGIWNRAVGFMNVIANSFRGSGHDVNEWINSGPLPSERFIFGNAAGPSSMLTGLLVAAEGGAY